MSDDFKWGAGEQEELARFAKRFKELDDRAGIHLCAAIDAEIKRWDAGTIHCAATIVFWLGVVMLRMADGADHELAHLLAPQIQELLAAAQHDAKLEILKREVGIG